MNKVKSHTDLEQSKKLAEILPLESADMAWCNNFIKGIDCTDKYSANLYTVKEMKETFDKELVGWDKYWKLIPCWSLAALLNILPTYELNNFGNAIQLAVKKEALETEGDETLLDLVVNMIIHLHKKKIL